MVSFRPHTIRKVYDNEYETNEFGDVIVKEPKLGEAVSCRYEPNGKASNISLGDGRVFLYTYTVYLDVTSPEFAYGDSVRLYDNTGKQIGEFVVLGFHRGQLNCKLWV